MKNNIIKYLIFILPIIVTSCIKDDTVTLKDQGSTFISIYGSTEKKLFFSPFTDVKKVSLFSVRKDANSNSALKSNTNVLLTAAPDIIDAYNKKNGTNFKWLPAEIYTLPTNPGVSISGDKLNLAFSSGDFSKDIAINLDGSKWDISNKYAVAYRITSADGGNKISKSDSVVSFISVKNKWDGIYNIESSTLVDVVNPALVSPYSVGTSTQYALETLSPTSCVVKDNTYGISVPATPIWTGSATSYYGSFGIIVEFDPATDKIVAVKNYFGTPANTRTAQLDASGINTYKNGLINIKFNMLQPSVVPAAPHIRCTWTDVWKYAKAR